MATEGTVPTLLPDAVQPPTLLTSFVLDSAASDTPMMLAITVGNPNPASNLSNVCVLVNMLSEGETACSLSAATSETLAFIKGTATSTVELAVPLLRTGAICNFMLPVAADAPDDFSGYTFATARKSGAAISSAQARRSPVRPNENANESRVEAPIAAGVLNYKEEAGSTSVVAPPRLSNGSATLSAVAAPTDRAVGMPAPGLPSALVAKEPSAENSGQQSDYKALLPQEAAQREERHQAPDAKSAPIGEKPRQGTTMDTRVVETVPIAEKPPFTAEAVLPIVLPASGRQRPVFFQAAPPHAQRGSQWSRYRYIGGGAFRPW